VEIPDQLLSLFTEIVLPVNDSVFTIHDRKDGVLPAFQEAAVNYQMRIGEQGERRCLPKPEMDDSAYGSCTVAALLR
jgi:hypothetical protein